MSGIHPVSAALLIGFGVVVSVSAVAYLVHWAVQRSRSTVVEDPIIDLTHFHSATEAFRQASEELAEREGQDHRTRSHAR